jgi:hypothetical protein
MRPRSGKQRGAQAWTPHARILLLRDSWNFPFRRGLHWPWNLVRCRLLYLFLPFFDHCSLFLIIFYPSLSVPCDEMRAATFQLTRTDDQRRFFSSPVGFFLIPPAPTNRIPLHLSCDCPFLNAPLSRSVHRRYGSSPAEGPLCHSRDVPRVVDSGSSSGAQPRRSYIVRSQVAAGAGSGGQTQRENAGVVLKLKR